MTSTAQYEFRHGPLAIAINPEAAEELSPGDPGKLSQIVGDFIQEHADGWLSRLSGSRLFADPKFTVKSVYADRRYDPPKLIRLIGDFEFTGGDKLRSRPFMISADGAGMMAFFIVRGKKGVKIYSLMRPVLRAGTGGIEIGIAGGQPREEGESNREWAERNLEETVGKLDLGKVRHRVLKLKEQFAADGSWSAKTYVWIDLIEVKKAKQLKPIIQSGDFLFLEKPEAVERHIRSQNVEDALIKGEKPAGLILRQKAALQVCISMEATWPMRAAIECVSKAQEEIASRRLRKGLKLLRDLKGRKYPHRHKIKRARKVIKRARADLNVG